MEKTNYKSKILLLIVVGVLHFSCVTEVDWEQRMTDFKIDQSMVVPIGEIELTLDDILSNFDDLEMIDDASNNIVVKYTDSLIWELNKVPTLGAPQPTVLDFSLFGLPVVNNYIELSLDNHLDLDINSSPEQRIDYFEALSAKLHSKIQVENLNIQPSSIEIYFEVKNSRMKWAGGQDAIIKIVPQSLGVNEVKNIPEFLLYTPSTDNIPINFRLRINTTGVVISQNSKIRLSTYFNEILPKAIYGKFTPTLSSLSQEKIVDLSSFIDMVPKNGLFKLAEPVIDFTVHNNTGIKLGLKIDKLEAYRVGDSSFPIIKAQFGTVFSTERIIDRKASLADVSKKSSFRIGYETDNGQIHRFFQETELPNTLKYQFSVVNARTDTEINATPDFLPASPSIKAYVDLRVPLKLNGGSYFEIKDTIPDLEFDSIFKTDIIDMAYLVFKISNGLPVKATLGVDLLDSNLKRVSLQLLSDSILLPPTLHTDGTVNTTVPIVPKTITIRVDKNQLSNLRKGKYLILRLRVDSKDGTTPITFQKSNAIKVKIGAFVKANANISITE